MVDGDRLDEIETELARMGPGTADGEPPEDPTPEELHEWQLEASQDPEISGSYFKMLEKADEMGFGPTIEGGPTDPTIHDGPVVETTDDDESDETDAHADSSDADPEPSRDLPAAVAGRLAAETIAALPEDIADDVPADLSPSEIDEAVGLLRGIAEREREVEPT